MIYLLKFGASFLLPPGIFLVAFIVLALVLWRKERGIAKVLLSISFIFYLLTTSLVADSLLGSLERRYEPPTNIAGHDVVIMLGGGATNGTPDIDGQGNLGGNAANRLLTAARLAKQLNVPLIVAGGQVYSDSGREAVVAKRILLGLGFADSQVIIEDQSLNTKQNAENVNKIMQERGYHKPLLITSAFHMERSILNFKKAGVAVTAYPADYMVSIKRDFYFNKLAPSAAALEGNAIFFREWLGIWAARLVS